MPCWNRVAIKPNPPGGLTDVGRAADWKTTAVLLSTALIGLLALYWSTAVSMVEIWARSETFAHGFVIVPISLFLIWHRRDALCQVVPSARADGLLLLLPLGGAWLAASITSVQVVQQLAFVAMIPVLVWSIAGARVVRLLVFALAYLFFAVPIGEGLIPHMMNFTAVFTIKLIQLTGIPIYVDGLYFSLPSGAWNVVEGCSGVRYLIASTSLGTLYAFLTYSSYHKRALFMLFSVVVPIIANGLRAYMIVMIAHYSDMTLALGVDHLIYGWIFFGCVILLMFWIGSFWAESETMETERVRAIAAVPTQTTPRVRQLVIAGAGIFLLSIWPLRDAFIQSQIAQPVPELRLLAPDLANDGWRPAPPQIIDWTPRYLGMDAELQQAYQKGSDQVGLYLAYYDHQRKHAELVNSQNIMIVQKHPVWGETERSSRTIRFSDAALTVVQSKLKSVAAKVLIWHWYRIGSEHTSNPYWAKVLEAKSTLLGTHNDALGIVVYTAWDQDMGAAEARLQAFVDSMSDAIDSSLIKTGQD
ncbi:MAG TPA: exosortase A [Chromatiales bacterium]|jgi:exosortase A|nr:exosortase A [Chromatiales bacterium]